jgi:hypothetical protein
VSTLIPAEQIGESPLEWYARSMANLIRIDLVGDGPDGPEQPARYLGAYFGGNVEVLEAPQIDDLGSKAANPPYCAVMTEDMIFGRLEASNLTPTIVVLRLITRLPVSAEDDPSAAPRERVHGAIMERIYSDRYGIGRGRLVHPDYMEAVPPGGRRPVITDGLESAVVVSGASATVGEDRLRDDYRVTFRTRLCMNNGRFEVAGSGLP